MTASSLFKKQTRSKNAKLVQTLHASNAPQLQPDKYISFALIAIWLLFCRLKKGLA